VSIDPEDLSPELRDRIVPSDEPDQDALENLRQKVDGAHRDMRSPQDAREALNRLRDLVGEYRADFVHPSGPTTAPMTVAEAERALKDARNAELRRRIAEEKLLPKDPVTIGNLVFIKESDVDADYAGKSRCDENVSANYPSLGTCTRPKNHLGEHGRPNWTGHMEVQKSFPLVKIETRNAHGGSGMTFTSYDQYQAVMAEIDKLVWAAFQSEGDDD
jgi:hypothetical protein